MFVAPGQVESDPLTGYYENNVSQKENRKSIEEFGLSKDTFFRDIDFKIDKMGGWVYLPETSHASLDEMAATQNVAN